MESHIIRFLAIVFKSMWLGLQDSRVENDEGRVIFCASSALLDFKYISEIANRAAGAVICKFTFGPSFIEELFVSFIKLVLIIDWGGSITLPPSINLINLYSNLKSLKLSFAPLEPRQIIPKAHPAAREYPYLSRHLSAQGFFPIWESVI